MNYEEKILIGGRALVALGSSRMTSDTDYLVFDEASKEAFIRDEENNVDYLNAASNDFFFHIWEVEKGREMASPQSLLELKAYACVQHCQNFNFQKADDCEYDMRFLARKFKLTGFNIVQEYITAGQLKEIQKTVFKDL